MVKLLIVAKLGDLGPKRVNWFDEVLKALDRWFKVFLVILHVYMFIGISLRV